MGNMLFCMKYFEKWEDTHHGVFEMAAIEEKNFTLCWSYGFGMNHFWIIAGDILSNMVDRFFVDVNKMTYLNYLNDIIIF